MLLGVVVFKLNCTMDVESLTNTGSARKIPSISVHQAEVALRLGKKDVPVIDFIYFFCHFSRFFEESLWYIDCPVMSDSDCWYRLHDITNCQDFCSRKVYSE